MVVCRSAFKIREGMLTGACANSDGSNLRAPLSSSVGLVGYFVGAVAKILAARDRNFEHLEVVQSFLLLLKIRGCCRLRKRSAGLASESVLASLRTGIVWAFITYSQEEIGFYLSSDACAVCR